MSFLIEKDGERVWTPTMEGYDGWAVLRQGAGAKPRDNADFAGGAWTSNAARKTACERKAKFVVMDREQLVDFLLDVIKKGDTRLDKLEAELAALKARPPAA